MDKGTRDGLLRRSHYEPNLSCDHKSKSPPLDNVYVSSKKADVPKKFKVNEVKEISMVIPMDRSRQRKI